jgi:hypothetical protein
LGFKASFLLQTERMHNSNIPPFARRPTAICLGLLFAPLIGLAQNVAAPSATKTPASESDTSIATSPMALRMTTEVLSLPGKEKMGIVGGSLLTDVADGVSLGIGSYGAVSGQRGGFITLGVAGQVRQRISPRWQAHAGLYVGAGGGNGGQALAGGGLMLRGDVGLTYETDGYGNFGLGLSHVNFPSGVIRSTQPYLLYEYPFYSLIGRGASNAGSGNKTPSSLRSKEQEFALVARSYKIPSSVVKNDGEDTTGRYRMAVLPRRALVSQA